MELILGTHQGAFDAKVEELRDANLCQRLWEKDPTIWFSEPVPEITDRLGWLTLPETMREQLDELRRFADEIQRDQLHHVVLLGMGGCSLAPEVFASTFGSAPHCPELTVLDSTHPAAVGSLERRLDLHQTLFLVSSKSGTTIETLSLFRKFWDLVIRRGNEPGRHFAAITDPETALEQLGLDRGFRKIFRAPPDVGGRYSALSVFGLVPAALIGVDVGRLLARSRTMAEACASWGPAAANPGITLGAALGELALAGRDKVTFLTSPQLTTFPDWLEQLIAESTGKDGKGILPVASEPPGSPEVYGDDRVFVSLVLEGDDCAQVEGRLTEIQSAGHPVVRIRLAEPADLAQEMFRWEVAVAVAGAVLGIHPFNQSDVQLAKDLTRRAMESGTQTASATAGDRGGEILSAELERWEQRAHDWLAAVQPGDYVALQVYLEPTPETTGALQALRVALRDRLKVATTIGYGPRFLHSTGQLHKGGPNTGLFLQLVDEPEEDIPVPETDYTFGALIRAQALGDYEALVQRGRRVLRVDVRRDVGAALGRLEKVL